MPVVGLSHRCGPCDNWNIFTGFYGCIVCGHIRCPVCGVENQKFFPRQQVSAFVSHSLSAMVFAGGSVQVLR
jgi:uncharacterized protein (DUF983 family)